MAAYSVPNYSGNYQMPNQMQNVQGYQQNQVYQQGQNYQPSIIQQSNSGYICRPVTGREEAVAMQVDFLGPGTLMPDFPHGIIYFKRFNPNTGAADFAEFRLAPPQPEPKPAQGVTMDDFNALADRVRKLEKMEGGIKMMQANPMMFLMQAARSGNPMGMLQQLAGQNPQISQAMRMMQGKSTQQLQKMAQNMANERGVSLNDVARQLGITIPSNR